MTDPATETLAEARRLRDALLAAHAVASSIQPPHDRLMAALLTGYDLPSIRDLLQDMLPDTAGPAVDALERRVREEITC